MAKPKQQIPDTSSLAEILGKKYYNAEDPASFGGISKLAKASGIPYKDTKQWLMTEDTYTLHKPTRTKFPRRKVIAYGIGELLESDLIDLSKYAKYNENYKYLLTTIDVFSKKLYAFPLKQKNADSVLDVFKKLLKQVKHINNLQTDEGKEFYNSKVQAFFKKNNINHYSSHSEHHASVVERVNRTLKEKLFRIFTRRNSYSYWDVLQRVINAYNNSFHRSIGFSPNEVTHDLEPLIFEKLYGYKSEPNFKFDVDNQVRISKTKKTFHKGYLPSWTDEVFKIHKRYPSNPPTYLLKDLKDEILKGRFYEEELQKIIKSKHDYWKLERVLKTRGNGAKKEYFVKWKGFDDRFNSWVKAEWMRQTSFM